MAQERRETPSHPERWELNPTFLAPIGDLVRRPPLFVERETSVAEAARRMREANASSVLVQGEPLGILTDRDLRNRVLAAGLPPSTPVGRVMSSPLFALPKNTPLYEAMAQMVERGIHHLAVSEGERILGVITHTDLLLHEAQSPLLLLRRIERLELKAYAAEVARLVTRLLEGGLSALAIGRVVASLNDALIRRLLKEAEGALGPPPTPYSLIVFGSEGRREQALLTDQDNALVLGEEGHEGYFQALAERVVSGLVQAGIPACPGGYMATRWRKTLGEWEATFRAWTKEPEPQALLEAQIFFDFRPVGGDLPIGPLEEAVRAYGQEPLFLRHLAQAALAFRPPLGLWGQVRTEGGYLDLKRYALAPIVALARLYALEAGSPSRSTLDRLEDAAQAGILRGEAAESLKEAYRFFFRLRLERQLQALKEGKRLENRLFWRTLPLGIRQTIRAHLYTLVTVQESTALRFGLR